MPGRNSQLDDRRAVQLRVGWIRDVLFLDRGVDVDLRQLLRRDLPFLHRHRHGFLQQGHQLVDTDPKRDGFAGEAVPGAAIVNLHKIWIEQCKAARRIEADFGTQKALEYLIGEKFINFLEAAEDHADFRSEIPAFVGEIKTIFERWQLAEYLEIARQSEPFDPSLYDDEEEAEMERQRELRKSASELLLVERAMDWLLAGDQ